MNMLIFDEKTMTKAKVTQTFALEDDNFCVAQSDFYGVVDVNVGDEAWVLDFKTSDNKTLFVYFPELDHATCIYFDLVEAGEIKRT